MKFAKELKLILNALTYAHAGENLSLLNKSRVVGGAQAQIHQAIEPAPAVTGPQVGLYMGSELSEDVIQYVLQTCVRLRHGLTVLTLQTEAEARSLLAPYQAAFDESKITVRVKSITGDPVAALARAIRRLPEVAFLVCNESGYLGHGLLNGTQNKDGLPVPVVMVAAKGDNAASLALEEKSHARRA